MDIQFIYDVVESNYTGLECYSIYDFTDNNVVYDVKLKKSTIALDTKNKVIYFLNMETDEHYILAKSYYYKIIKEFIDKSKDYGCEDYKVFEGTTGGQIYYNYK